MGKTLDDTKLDANNKGIVLAFPKYETEEDDEYISKGGTREGLVKYLSTSMDSIASWFKYYQVETIELHISGAMETGGITKLVISAKGEGGMKVELKPKPH
ncbi:MAG TPA: hypothetical protein VH500_13705 [Nitrososphaeraceae archaeon]|jgi:hypothetical protein